MTHHRRAPLAHRLLHRGWPALPTATALACTALASAAAAGPLSDPTRPPAALAAPGGLAAAALPHQANRDTARAIAAAQRAAEPPPPSAPVVVQSVQLPAPGATTGAAVALVDGRLVKLGDQLDGRPVLAIDAQGLLVKGPRGPERLWLLGGAPKQAAGSITQSQSARFQPAPMAAPSAGPATAGADPAANLAERDSATGQPDNTSATATPLSLAKRTAP